MAISNSFSAVANLNRLSRNFGGVVAGTAEPYLSGTHFIKFVKLPSRLYEFCGFEDNNTIQNILTATCLSVTNPGGTLNNIDMPGLGGTKWGIPGSIDYGNTFSSKYLEMRATPILNIHSGWVKMIRDYRTGISNLVGDEYSKRNYAAIAYVWTTLPDGKTIEFYACYDGVYPLKDPQDLYSSDIETQARLDVEIEYHLDYPWREDWVKTKCQVFADEIHAHRATIQAYGQTVASAT